MGDVFQSRTIGVDVTARPVIWVVGSGPQQRRQLEVSLGDWAVLRMISVSKLLEGDPAGWCADLVVLWQSADQELGSAAAALRVRQALPGVPLLILLQQAGPSGRQLARYSKLDAFFAIPLTDSDLRILADGLLRRAPHERLTTVVRALGDELLDPKLIELFAVILPESDGIINVRDLAKALGVTTRTLTRRARQSGFPSPRALLDWAKLLWTASIDESVAPPPCGHVYSRRTWRAIRSRRLALTGPATERVQLRRVARALAAEILAIT